MEHLLDSIGAVLRWRIKGWRILLMALLLTIPGISTHPADAAPAITIRVTTTDDTNASDSAISLREAILLVNGGTGGDGVRTGLGRALSANESLLISGGTIGNAATAANIVFTDLSAVSVIALSAGTGSPNESLPPIMTSGVVIDGTTGSGTPITVDGSGAGVPASSDILWLGSVNDPTAPTVTVPVDGITVRSIAIQGAKRYGIHLDPARTSTVSGCAVTASTSYAIFINGKFGPADGNTVENCTVGNNASLGIVVNRPNAFNTTIRDNRVGTNAAGNAAAPNTGAGIAFFTGTHDNLITGNLISGNTLQGIYFDGSAVSVTNNQILGNKIGTAVDGVTGLPNVQGIVLGPGSINNVIGGTSAGQANTIAFNTESGIVVVGNATISNRLSGNSIFQNTILGIDLLDDKLPTQGVSGGTAGPNRLALRPTLTTARVSSSLGFISGTASPLSTIELFEADPSPSGYGSGKVYCASATAAADGTFAFNGTMACASPAILTATSTLADGSTSEFGQNRATTPAERVWLPFLFH